ncbi:MAG: hypothetical protein WC295_01565 [Methanoregula sp.]
MPCLHAGLELVVSWEHAHLTGAPCGYLTGCRESASSTIMSCPLSARAHAASLKSAGSSSTKVLDSRQGTAEEFN